MSKQDSGSNSDVAAELRNIEDQLAAAWVAGDRSVHERVLSEDWSVIDAQGRIRTKAQVLEEMFQPGERSITGRIDEVNVRPYGDWAVVTGKTHVAGRYEGNEINVTLRFMDVFRRAEGKWQVVASQATLLNQ
jgi:ketosteroid isomerase-like protein